MEIEGGLFEKGRPEGEGTEEKVHRSVQLCVQADQHDDESVAQD